MSQISILYRLQQIDSQLDSIRIALQKVDEELGNTSIVDIARQNVTQAEQELHAETIRLRDIENKASSVRIKKEQDEASLYGGKIQNPKELQDLQNDIASLGRQLESLENNELEIMMSVEEAETKLTSLNGALKVAQGQLIEHQATLNGERSKLLDKIVQLEAERKATIPPIPPSDLSLYEQLRKNRKGVAVAKISSRACGACGTTLTAAMVQSAQLPTQLIRCPTCGRILYPG